MDEMIEDIIAAEINTALQEDAIAELDNVIEDVIEEEVVTEELADESTEDTLVVSEEV